MFFELCPGRICYVVVLAQLSTSGRVFPCPACIVVFILALQPQCDHPVLTFERILDGKLAIDLPMNRFRRTGDANVMDILLLVRQHHGGSLMRRQLRANR